MRYIATLAAQLVIDPLRFKFVRYVISGGGSFTADYGIFLLLVYVFDINLTLATRVSGSFGYIAAFLFHKFWTFESKEIYKAWWQLPAHFMLKVVWNSWYLTPFLLLYLVDSRGWYAWLAKAVIGVAIGLLQNFPVCRYIIFNQKLLDWIAKQRKPKARFW